MPWKSSTPVDLRMEFITRLHKGERIADLCREYGIGATPPSIAVLRRIHGHEFHRQRPQRAGRGISAPSWRARM